LTPSSSGGRYRRMPLSIWDRPIFTTMGLPCGQRAGWDVLKSSATR